MVHKMEIGFRMEFIETEEPVSTNHIQISTISVRSTVSSQLGSTA